MSITDHPDPIAFAPPRVRAVQPADPEPPAEPTPTWLGFIADGITHLTYAEMKDFARGVLGAEAKPDEIIEFADKLHDWSLKTKVPQ